MTTSANDSATDTGKADQSLRALEGGPAVRMRADELAPFGWAPCSVLAAVNLVDRIDANIVAGVLPLLQEEWGFSDTLGGAIPTAGAIAGIAVSMPAGYLADRHRRTQILAVVLASWAVLTGLSALALGFWMFFAIRTVLGAADNIDNPASSSLLADFYPPRARARAFGYQRMAYYVGGSLGVLLGGVLGELFGWRVAFLAMVVPGLAVAGLCFILREPIRGAIDQFVAAQAGGAEVVRGEDAAQSAETWVERAEAGDTGAAEGSGMKAFLRQMRDLLRVKTLFYVYVGLAVLFFGLGGIFYWLPSFYERYRDVGEGAAGGLTALVSLVGILSGTYAGGRIGDRWHRSRPGGRIVLSGGGLLGGSVVLAFAFDTPTLVLQVAVLTLSVALLALAVPNLTAAVADVLPAAQRGVGFALFSFLTSIGGALGPLAVGFVSDATGELKAAFYVLVAPAVIGSLVVLRARHTYDRDAEQVLERARSAT